MKTLIILMVPALIFQSACTNNNSQSERKNSDSSVTNAQRTQVAQAADTDAKPSEIAGIVADYLVIKNALANDDGEKAANGGKAMALALQNLDAASLPDAQKKAYADMADDLKENAEHISQNAGKIAHQREHFEMLSGDMYDLIKAEGSHQKLYEDFCPMYNNGKGATWLSETKEIQNPYLGKKMPTCGSVKEEINQQ